MDYQDLLRTHPELFANQDALINIITDPDTIQAWQVQRRIELADKGLPFSQADLGVMYEDAYILILRDLVMFPSGRMVAYSRLVNRADLMGGKGAACLPVLDGKILLLRQFRHATRSWHWEIPRGFGEPNTPPEENVKKELLEEIGAEVSELTDLGGYHSNTGIEGVSLRLFLARLRSVGEPNLDEGIASYQLFSVDTVKGMICDGEITDGFTIAAFSRAFFRHFIS